MLNRKIKQLLKSLHVDCFGVADISQHEDDLAKLGGDIVRGFDFGLSIGIALPPAIIEGLSNRFDINNAALYRSHAYHVINDRLDNAASVIGSFLSSKGFKNLPIQAAERTDLDNALPTVSHKMIANLAGLGWIGKNCLLITPKHGPRVRLSTILANGPFKAAAKKVGRQCGACSACVAICPVQALTGRSFDATEGREARFDFKRCHDYHEEMKKNIYRQPICGMCIFACPIGKNSKFPIIFED